jgi:GNAT superfamily N-acetyltransferase
LIIIRHIEEGDAIEYLALLRQLDTEAKYMTVEEGERSMSVNQMRQRVRNIVRQHNSTVLLAKQDGHACGYLACYGGGHRRNRHRAGLAVGVLAAQQGNGVGAALFTALWDWVNTVGLMRFEVDVIESNHAALALYQKQGFTIEGMRICSIWAQEMFHNELRMAKILAG